MRLHWVFLAAAAVVAIASSLTMPEASFAGDFSEYVDDNGVIALPTSYRTEWVHLGSWSVPDEKAPGAGFHDVYARAEDVRHYNKNKEFPDGAVLVKEIRKAVTRDMTTGTVTYAGKPAVWFVMIKDSKGRFKGNANWGDGWGWALFNAESPDTNSSMDYKMDCIPCHTPAKETDWVYIEGYPTLE